MSRCVPDVVVVVVVAGPLQNFTVWLNVVCRGELFYSLVWSLCRRRLYFCQLLRPHRYTGWTGVVGCTATVYVYVCGLFCAFRCRFFFCCRVN